jgi:hypothetical protein
MATANSFVELIKQILAARPDGMTPQEIRETIKARYPAFYGTEAHRRNVEKGNYHDLDHALLAQIYVTSRSSRQIAADRSRKPMRLSISTDGAVPGPADVSTQDEDIGAENLERLEAGIGTLYVLGTNLFTKEGTEIVKIGITSGNVESRVSQLYTTGVPFRFRVISQFETKNFNLLEQSLHKLLDPYRVNQSREFFLDKCLPHVERVIAIHKDIHMRPEAQS